MSNEDVLMDDPEAAQAARGSVRGSLYDELQEGCDWRYELTTRYGLDPKVLIEGYTPMEGCRGIEHERTRFKIENENLVQSNKTFSGRNL